MRRPQRGSLLKLLLSPWQRLGLKPKLTMMAIVVATLPLLTAGGLAYWATDQSIKRRLGREQLEQAERIGEGFNQFLEEQYSAIQLLTTNPILIHQNLRDVATLEQKQQLLDTFKASFGVFDSVILFDVEGNPLLQAQTDQPFTGNYGDRAYFQDALRTKTITINGPGISPSSGILRVEFAAPIQDSATGQVIAIVRARIPSQPINDVMAQQSTEGNRWHLLNEEGVVFAALEASHVSHLIDDYLPAFSQLVLEKTPTTTIVEYSAEHPLDAQGYLGQPASQPTEAQGSAAQSSALPPPGYDLVSYVPFQLPDVFPNRQFGILIQTNTQIVFAARRSLKYLFLMSTCAAAIVVGTGTALLVNRAIHPIKLLTDIAQRVTQGPNFQLRAPITSQDELGILATSFNQLIQWIEVYTQELATTQKTLEAEIQGKTQALEELQETQAQLIHTEKMSSLGQMVAGIAHEVNNPTNFIHANLEHVRAYSQDLLDLVALYDAEYPADQHPAIQQKIDEIDLAFIQTDFPNVVKSMRLGTQRVQAIVQSLRNFSRLDEAEVKQVDLHEGLDSTLLILTHRLKKMPVKVVKHYSQIPMIWCHSAQINQVFTNLITNAIDAMEGANTAKPHLVIHTSCLNDDQVQINISDNGPGVPRNIQSKIFNPFFTTKPTGKGTGLGLGICYKIIHNHGGQIGIKSSSQGGTSVILTLPIQVSQGTETMAVG